MKDWKPVKLLIIAVLAVCAVVSLFRVARTDREMRREERKEAQIEQLEQAGFGAEQLAEAQYFPVAVEEGKECVSFEDGFGDTRTYGGDRKHEGTDIMAADGKSGYYPVVSISDGVIDKVGWLELGGYRVGVRSPSGVYYYYAHLDSYASDCVEGKEIHAGDLLGFLGDSGYGEEGTTGQFEPHLHLGVYLTNDNGEEYAINPYPLLIYNKERKILFRELEVE